MKDKHTVGKKKARNGRKWAFAIVIRFDSEYISDSINNNLHIIVDFATRNSTTDDYPTGTLPFFFCVSQRTL